MNIVIVKLGGSVITAKHSRRPVFRSMPTLRLARELAGYARRHPGTALVILHGAGSFGHPLAHAYGLVNGQPTRRRLAGLALTQASMLRLNARVVGALQTAGLAAVGVATHQIVQKKRHRIRIAKWRVVNDLVSRGQTPVLYGDAILTGDGKTDIVSADDLAVELSRLMSVRRIIFATDVDGVYRNDGRRDRIPRLSRSAMRAMVLQKSPGQSAADVTGGMLGKLGRLASLRRTTVAIVNGQKPGRLGQSLRGRNVGTLIRL